MTSRIGLDTPEAPSWAELGGGLGDALGGLILALQAFVIVPGLLGGLLLGALLVLPFVAVGAVAGVLIGVPLGALRLVRRLSRPRAARRATPA